MAALRNVRLTVVVLAGLGFDASRGMRLSKDDSKLMGRGALACVNCSSFEVAASTAVASQPPSGASLLEASSGTQQRWGGFMKALACVGQADAFAGPEAQPRPFAVERSRSQQFPRAFARMSQQRRSSDTPFSISETPRSHEASASRVQQRMTNEKPEEETRGFNEWVTWNGEPWFEGQGGTPTPEQHNTKPLADPHVYEDFTHPIGEEPTIFDSDFVREELRALQVEGATKAEDEEAEEEDDDEEDWPFKEKPILQDYELKMVKAHDINSFLYDVYVPASWKSKFEEHGVALVHVSRSAEVYTATLKSNPKYKVAFKVMATEDPRAQREIFIRQRLTDLVALGEISWEGIDPMIEAQVFEDSTFLMLHAAGGNLRDFLNMRHKRQATPTTPLSPLTISMNLLLDVLRGCENLQKAGIVHADLTEHNILLYNGRAYITDFSTSCVMHSGDKGYGCENLRDGPQGLVGSAYHHPPEMAHGRPTGPENNIWQVGLIFAEMFLGYPPMGYGCQHVEQPDTSEQVRNHIETVIRDRFRIEDAPGFAEAPSQIQALLSGMLDKNPRFRLSAGDAIDVALRTCIELDIEVWPSQSLPGMSDIPRPRQF